MRSVLCVVLCLLAGEAWAQGMPPMMPPVVNQQIVTPSGPPAPVLPPNSESWRNGWTEKWEHTFRPYQEWENRYQYPYQYNQPIYNQTTGCVQRDVPHYQPYCQPTTYCQPTYCQPTYQYPQYYQPNYWRSWCNW